MTTETPAAENPARALAFIEAANFLRDAHFLHGMSVQEIGTALRNTADAADPRVGSLARDGFGLDEIAQMLADPGTTEQADTVAAPGADRRERYAAAIREADGWVLDDGQHMIDAVMTVADTEQAELRATVLREAADHAESLREFESATGARWAAQVSENVGILRVADSLRRLAAEAQQPTPAPAEETK